VLYALFFKLAMKNGKNKNKTNLNKVKQMIKSEMQKELKLSDSYIVQAMTNLGTITRWTPPPIGNNSYQRVADVIYIDNIEIRMFTVYGDVVGNPCRAILMQTAGGYVPTVTDVLSFGATGSQDTTSDYVPYIKGKQIRILYDSHYSVVPNATSAILCKHLKLKPKIKCVEFNQGATTVRNGDLYWLFLSDSLVVPHPAIDIAMRVWFRDP